jgi:hypothetical protein
MQAEEQPPDTVAWEIVVDCLTNEAKPHDVEIAREKCQDCLISLSWQISRCENPSTLHHILKRLEEVSAFLSLPNRASGITDDANMSVPANKKVLPQRPKTDLF